MPLDYFLKIDSKGYFQVKGYKPFCILMSFSRNFIPTYIPFPHHFWLFSNAKNGVLCDFC